MSQISPQVLFATSVEGFLVVLSCLLVVQPESVFGRRSRGVRLAASYAGWIALCLTFCWSVIFGCVLVLNDLTLRI